MTNHQPVYIDEPYLKVGTIMTILKQKGLFSDQPVLTLPFIDWFNSYDFSNFDVLEFGSGFSTNFFADRTKIVTSFETDPIWYNSAKINIKSNVIYNLVSVKDIEENNLSFNITDNTIILIDCAANRYLVAENILNNYKPPIIILDNSEWYPNASEIIYNNGYSEIPLWGFRFIEHYESCTSIFIKDGYKIPKKNEQYFSAGSRKLPSINTWDMKNKI